MEWSESAIVVARRRHGENGAIVTLFAREHGRHLGLVRGSGRRVAGLYEPGNLVAAHWRARLEAHLGVYTAEPIAAHAAQVLDDADRLAALASCAALIDLTLPEREPHPALYDATLALLQALPGPDWAARYVRWECASLAELGYGLALERCAVSGAQDELTHVSPKTGRAVNAAHVGEWRDRLLPLPAFLAPDGPPPSPGDLRDGLALTGHFLERQVFAPLGKRMPAARARLLERVRRLDRVAAKRI
jgi:DNA repair protein RecO (recombination protein O)